MPDPVEALLAGGDRPNDYRRDRHGRPLIAQRDGTTVPYTRSSSAAKTIDDTYNLELWARRNVAYGLAHDRSLVARVLAVGGTPHGWSKDDKRDVNAIVEDAAKMAKAHEGADIGTALHHLTAQLDLGLEVRPGHYAGDLDAYTEAINAAGLEVDADYVECKTVCDGLKMAGTADRLYGVDPSSKLAELLDLEVGDLVVGDLKTGESVNYGALGWAAQLAAYAHGELYDPATGERIWTPRVNRRRGLIVHLPAGHAVCTLYLVDLEAGYRAAELANEIRATRSAARGWLTPLEGADPPQTVDTGAALLASIIARANFDLRARLQFSFDPFRAGRVAWPDDVPFFKDGGAQTWAHVLLIERAVMDAERITGAEFRPRYMPDPLAPVEPSRYRYVVTNNPKETNQ